MKKALFIDRDGTLIVEPPIDFQIDSLEKLEFVPGVFRTLYNIKKNLDFELVIVSNQDGLGTDVYPEKSYNLVQNKMLTTFKNEGIEFDEILIDKSFPEDNSPNRKPKTGLLTKYMNGDYDLENSWVIGDRITDIELAKNLGCQGILLNSADKKSEIKAGKLEKTCALISTDWDKIYEKIASSDRTASVERNTKETQIKVHVNLDGKGNSEISTGLGFFDHMLDQIAKHGGVDLNIRVNGDLHVDEHHTIEDTGLALGEAFLIALGNKRGVERYGYVLPMDDCLAQVAIDFGGRPWIVWDAEFNREMVGDLPTEMFFHFFKSFSDASKSNLNIKAEGTNEHHKIEAIFKALARAIKMAIKKDVFNYSLPSTKGMI